MKTINLKLCKNTKHKNGVDRKAGKACKLPTPKNIQHCKHKYQLTKSNSNSRKRNKIKIQQDM